MNDHRTMRVNTTFGAKEIISFCSITLRRRYSLDSLPINQLVIVFPLKCI